jgi:hypothetical protein
MRIHCTPALNPLITFRVPRIDIALGLADTAARKSMQRDIGAENALKGRRFSPAAQPRLSLVIPSRFRRAGETKTSEESAVRNPTAFSLRDCC